MSDLEKRSYWFALIAMVISVLALLISFYEVNILREQQELQLSAQKTSVWPYLVIKNSLKSNDGKLNISTSLVNKGVGPALVRRSELTLFNKVISDYLSTHKMMQDSMGASYIGLSLNPQFEGVISPQEEIVLFKLDLEASTLNGQKRFDYIPEPDICYCSIYEDCWRIKNQETNQLEEPCD